MRTLLTTHFHPTVRYFLRDTVPKRLYLSEYTRNEPNISYYIELLYHLCRNRNSVHSMLSLVHGYYDSVVFTPLGHDENLAYQLLKTFQAKDHTYDSSCPSSRLET